MSYIKEKPCDKQNTATDHCRRFFFGLDLTNHIKHQFVFAFAILKKMKSLIDGVNSSLYLFLDMFVCFFFHFVNTCWHVLCVFCTLGSNLPESPWCENSPGASESHFDLT